MALKENYKDDILDVSVNTKRKYRMTENQDGTISLEDETVYTQEGDSFGASDMNATNSKVNTLDANLDGFKFYPTGTDIVGLIADDSAYIDENGNYVIWGTPTAEQLVEDNPNTYKSVPSEEDLRGKVGEDIGMSFGAGGASKAEIVCELSNMQLGGYSSYGGNTLKIDVSEFDSVYIAMYGASVQDGARPEEYLDNTLLNSGAGMYCHLVGCSVNDWLYLRCSSTSNGGVRFDGIVIGYKTTPKIETLPYTKYNR